VDLGAAEKCGIGVRRREETSVLRGEGVILEFAALAAGEYDLEP